MAMIGPTSSRAPSSAASSGAALAQMALDVLDHDDGVVDHQTDGEHDGQQRQQVDGEAEHLHEEHRADERQGMATTGTSTARIEPRKRKMTMTTISSVSLRVLITSWMAL